jgi:hypothetical protein
VTNGYSNRLRTSLSLAQPTGSWTNGFRHDGAKRLTNVTSQAGAFDHYLGAAAAASPLAKKIALHAFFSSARARLAVLSRNLLTQP